MDLRPKVRSALSAVRLLVLWDRLRGTFWFVPSLMTIGAIALSFALSTIDSAIEDDVYRRLEWIYLFGPEGARAILSAIASSMITVAGLTFSITMLTLQLASAQFGPRLLRNFMRDRGNQMVLGTFISTFVYCLLVLRTIKGVEGSSFVPHISVAVGVLLAVASLAVLIYFIHHTAHSIRIETQLATLAAEMAVTIDRLYPDKLGHDDPAEGPIRRPFPVEGEGAARQIRSPRSGYVQFVDTDALMNQATRHDLLVRIAVPPGAFVTPVDTLISLSPADGVTEDIVSEISGVLVIGDERTPDQDLSFSLRRIVEIAQRALSPGINDPTTALYCIDRLGEALERLAKRKMPASGRYDEKGEPRVWAERISFHDLALGAFSAVAHYGAGDVDVMSAVAAALSRVIRANKSCGSGELVRLQNDIASRRIP